jgi:hypothetical protein
MADLDLFEEVKALTRALEVASLPYAICGGIAVGIHGAPRATRDVDLLVAPERLDEIKMVARALGFVLEALPIRFRATNMVMHRVSKVVDGSLLSLDLLVVNDDTAPVYEARERVEYEGGHFWVVSRQGLISMKVAAGRAQDVFDLERLQDEE